MPPPRIIDSPPPLYIHIQPLTPQTFSPFGTVIQNPLRVRNVSPQTLSIPPPPPLSDTTAVPVSVSANQGTALKYTNMSNMQDLYASAPSRVPSRPVMSLFVCKPRELGTAEGKDWEEGVQSRKDREGRRRGDGRKRVFKIEVLERHPFTTQTFIQLGVPSETKKDGPGGVSKDEGSGMGEKESLYLVIVASSLPLTVQDQDLPYPTLSSSSSSSPSPSPSPSSTKTPPNIPPPGLPSLRHIHAFLAHPSQAITYHPGTWHAPMVVLGPSEMDFVVVQYANEVVEEDCQEVFLGKNKEEVGEVRVLIPGVTRGLARL